MMEIILMGTDVVQSALLNKDGSVLEEQNILQMYAKKFVVMVYI
jgi:hypothetical protein